MDWSDTQTVVRLWSLRPWLYQWHHVLPLATPDKAIDDRWRKWLREASLLENNRDFSLAELSKHEMNVVDRAYKAYLVVFSNKAQFDASANDLLQIQKNIIQISPMPPSEALEELIASMLRIPTIQQWRKQLSSKEDDIMLLIFVCYNYCLVNKVCQKLDGGLTVLKKMMFDETEPVLKLREKGNQEYTDGKFRDAIRTYSQALEQQPFGFKLYSNRALAYSENKQGRAAASDGMRCVRIEPTWDKGWRRYASGLFSMGQYEEAWAVNQEGQKHCYHNKAELVKQTIFFQENLEAAAMIQQYMEEHPELTLPSSCSHKPRESLAKLGPSSESSTKTKGARVAASSTDRVDAYSDCDDIPDLVADEEVKRPLVVRKESKGGSTTLPASLHSSVNPTSAKSKTTKMTEAATSIKNNQSEKKGEKQNSKASVAKKKKEEKTKKTAKITKELSPLAVDTKSLLSEGTKALMEKRMRNAATFFWQALSKIDNILQKELLYHDEQVAIIKYALGYANIHIGTEKDVEDGLQQFYSIETQYRTLVFPLAFLGMGMAYCRWNKYKEAYEPLAKGLRIVNKHSPRPVLTWPESTEPIEETKGSKLKESFEYYLTLCRQPPKPEALCRFKDCTQYQIAIYISDPDFKGYVEVHCYAKCRIAFHYLCWKKAKTSSDKEILSGSCWTPDCNAQLKKIVMIDQNGEIAKDLYSDNPCIRNEPKKLVIKMKPSSQYTINRRLQKKQLRKDRREEARIEKLLKQNEPEEKNLGDNEENDNNKVAPVKAAHQIDLQQCTKIMRKREEQEDEENKKQRKKKKLPKDKVLTLIDFNNQDHFSSGPPSTPSLGSFGGLDDFDEFPDSCPVTESDGPFSVVSRLVPTMTQLEERKPPSPTPLMEHSTNPWTRKHTPSESSSTSPQTCATDSESDKIDEKNNRLAIRNSLFELFKTILLKHGPLHIEDPIITEQLADFPPCTQDIIDREGGLNKFLGKSLYFSIFSDYVGLMKDTAKIRKIAAKKKAQSRKKTSSESSSKGAESSEPALLSSGLEKMTSGNLAGPLVPPARSAGSEPDKRDGTPDTTSSRHVKKVDRPVSTDDQSTSPDGSTGSHHVEKSRLQVESQPVSKVNSPVLDQYRLGVNRLEVAMELGRLAKSVNMQLGVEIRLLYGWKIFDGLIEGVSEEERELAMSMLQDTLDDVMKSAHKHYQAHGADIYFFGVGETSADSHRNRWVTGPEVGRNRTIVISLLFGNFSPSQQISSSMDPVSQQVWLHVRRAADFIDKCGDRFRASLDIQKTILPIFIVLGKKVTLDPETLALLESSPIPAIPKLPPGLTPIETSQSLNFLPGAGTSSPVKSSSNPLSTILTPALPVISTSSSSLATSLGDSLFMPTTGLTGETIWSTGGVRPASLPSLYNGSHFDKERSEMAIERQKWDYERQTLLRELAVSQMDVQKLTSQVGQRQQQLEDLHKEKNMYAEQAQNLSNKYKASLIERDHQMQQYADQQRNYEDEQEQHTRDVTTLQGRLQQLQQSSEEKLTKAQKELEELKTQLLSERERRHVVEMNREQELLEKERTLRETEGQLHQEKHRAQTAEVNQLRIKLDVGLRIIGRSAKEAEAKVSHIQQELQRCQDLGYPIPEAFRAAERAWKKTLQGINKTKENSMAMFEDQMRKVTQGEKLANLPVLDIPCPPPPPEMPSQQSLQGSVFPVGATGDSTAQMPTMRDAFNGGSLFTKSLPAGPAGGHDTQSKTRTAADIVAASMPPASKTVQPPKKPAAVSRPPGFGLTTSTTAAKVESKKNSFDKLFESLMPHYPQFTRSDMSGFLRQLREERGSLSGLSMMAVKESMERLINDAVQNRNAMSSSGWTIAGAKRINGHDALRSAKISETSDEDPCTICLDDLTTNYSIQLACQHRFHDHCIRKWFSTNSTCPLCQKHTLLPDEYPALC